MTHLGLVTVVVRDYDEAVAFYVDRLGFELLEDTRLGAGKRWVVVAPPGARESAVLLARGVGEEQQARIGDQTGGRVGWFLHTEAFDRDYARMRAAGVVFEEAPRQEPYGTVAVFRDLYGNRWDLIQLHRPGVATDVRLPTALVARYRAVDREIVGSALVDTPRHLDALTVDIGRHGVLTPLRLGFNEEFGTLDGNHRIAVALRLGLESVPVTLVREPLIPRPGHAQPMLPADLTVLEEAVRRQ